ncbi:MAG: hypothetical protein COB96_05045 [Planctomycetota bacterium]|nr:MAG: hypothetical protein COB96_05045 [Planctomycetota bacterium]
MFAVLILGWMQLAAPTGEALSASSGNYQGFPEQDALSYQIELEFDYATKQVAATARLRFRLITANNRLRLHSIADDGWEVVIRDSAGKRLEVERNGQVITVLLGREYPAGSVVELDASMNGNPPDGLYLTKNRYGEPILFTDHFSSRARGWLPCEDHPSDRAAFSLKLVSEDGWEVIASGEDVDGDGTWETHTDLPTYMFAFATGPYARITELGDERFIPHFIYQKDKPKARLGLKHHAAWMKSMEVTFGPYAWEKYCVVQVPTRWGGVENAGNTFIMERLFDGRDRGVGTLAHEFVHMWFGNAAGYGEWHEAWLSEGFASYFGPWLYAQTGGPPLRNALDGARRRWRQAACADTRPVRWMGYPKPDDLFGSSAPNTYQKGAWVLHMLRQEIGDQAFFGGISDYYKSISSGYGTTPKFQAAMEQACGRELGWFFSQWLDRPGCPRLNLKWQGSSLIVTQVQEFPFRFRLPLQWTNQDGEKVDRNFEISDAVTVIDLGGQVTAPVVDPRVELLWAKE